MPDMRTNTDRIVGWTFDLKDQLRLATRITDSGDTEILRLDNKGFTKVYSCNVFESCGPDRFHKDGRRVYFETNKGTGIDLSAEAKVAELIAAYRDRGQFPLNEGQADHPVPIFVDAHDTACGSPRVNTIVLSMLRRKRLSDCGM